MQDFVRKLITEWRRLGMPVADATVIAGVSGGADSVSLLIGLDELRNLGKLRVRLVAAHFNHGLRDGESDADEEFVRRLTTERKIELAVGRSRKRIEGSDLEQKARDARYEFLRHTAEAVGAHALVTGHTINDQAETFLINLIRGSGPDGLCGMRPVREFHNMRAAQDQASERRREPSECDTDISDLGAGHLESSESSSGSTHPLRLLLVRPLLRWATRQQTEGFCHAMSVEYRYDTMNEDTAFKRVRIRKILLPLLHDFNPNIVETLANTASLMQPVTPTCNHSSDADELSIRDLLSLESAALMTTIRSWLRVRRGTTRQLTSKHLRAVERLIRSEKSGRVAEIPGGRVIKSGGKLTYVQNNVWK